MFAFHPCWDVNGYAAFFVHWFKCGGINKAFQIRHVGGVGIAYRIKVGAQSRSFPVGVALYFGAVCFEPFIAIADLAAYAWGNSPSVFGGPFVKLITTHAVVEASTNSFGWYGYGVGNTL